MAEKSFKCPIDASGNITLTDEFRAYAVERARKMITTLRFPQFMRNGDSLNLNYRVTLTSVQVRNGARFAYATFEEVEHV